MNEGGVRYARNGDVQLADRVLGDGEIPLVLVPGWVSNVDFYDDPAHRFASLVEQPARQPRLILWDAAAPLVSAKTEPLQNYQLALIIERCLDLYRRLPVAGRGS